jgi:SAM-dependent methyltransferase
VIIYLLRIIGLMDSSNAKDYWERRLSDSYGLHGVGFIGLGKHYNAWMYKIRKTVFLSNMKRLLNLDLGNCAVLDVGSGTGFYIDLWKRIAVGKVVGTDITSIATERLKQKYPNNEFYELDIGSNIDLLFRSKFDIVSAFDVLFHITDDSQYEKAIDNIHSLLRPGGFFVFSENFIHQAITLRSEHQVIRGLDSIQDMIVRKGFKIIKRCPMFAVMNAPVDSQNRLLKAIWTKISSLIRYNENLGMIIGALLYPLELTLVFSLKESPTTEMMICKKLK